MITTEWFFGEENLTDAHFIRRKVFIEGQGIAEAEEFDGTDSACAHLVAYDDEDTPAATGRVMITAEPNCCAPRRTRRASSRRPRR